MMQIGTPLSPSATRVMPLGSGELRKEVIIALRRLGVEVITGIACKNVAVALQVPQSDLRLFGKLQSYIKRRMGVALANGANIVEARERAQLVAARVRPVAI